MEKIKFDKGFLLSLSACFTALILCLSIWPPVHRVYDDEYVYISQSVNILSSGHPSIILKGSRLQPDVVVSWTANTKFPGFAWLEAGIFFLTGDFEHSYFILNIVLGTLSVAMVYRIAWLLTTSYAVAWWSAILMACLPARITYSMSAACDISGSFFFLLFLLFLGEYRASKFRRLLYAALFSGIYCICIKTFYLIFVISGLGAALYIYRRDGLLDKKSCSQILLVAFFLFIPFLSAMPFMLISDSKAGAYSLSFMFKNIHSSISYLFDYKQSTFLTALAALAAVGRFILYKKDNLSAWLAGWFMMGLVLISVFCAGGISYPGEAYSDRYILSIVFPFVLLAAKGVVDVSAMVQSRLLTGFLFIILVGNAFYASHNLDAIAKDWDYYKKTLLLKKMVSVIPDKAYVIEECAALVAAETSMRSIQTRLFLSGDHPKEVVYLNGINDFTDPHRTDLV